MMVARGAFGAGLGGEFHAPVLGGTVRWPCADCGVSGSRPVSRLPASPSRLSDVRARERAEEGS